MRRWLRKLVSWHRARSRRLDRALLWPSCVELSSTKHQAVGAFLVHASMDPAWHEELSLDEIVTTLESWWDEDWRSA